MANTTDKSTVGKADLRLPDGIWRVDPRHGEVGFAAKGLWGLVTVHGVFTAFAGSLEVRAGNAVGDLTVDAASLDTGNAKRDKHLRSADFFEVERYPQIVFGATAVTPPDGDLIIAGDLAIGASHVHLEIPVEVEQEGDGLLVEGETTVSCTAAGITWNRLGALRDDARLHAKLRLVRDS